jgi:hypothetical protein
MIREILDEAEAEIQALSHEREHAEAQGRPPASTPEEWLATFLNERDTFRLLAKDSPRGAFKDDVPVWRRIAKQYGYYAELLREAGVMLPKQEK